MKFFLLMAWDGYYPSGGTADWIDTFHSVDEALKEVEKFEMHGVTSYVIRGARYDYHDIIDLRDWLDKK